MDKKRVDDKALMEELKPVNLYAKVVFNSLFVLIFSLSDEREIVNMRYWREFVVKGVSYKCVKFDERVFPQLNSVLNIQVSDEYYQSEDETAGFEDVPQTEEIQITVNDQPVANKVAD